MILTSKLVNDNYKVFKNLIQSFASIVNENKYDFRIYYSILLGADFKIDEQLTGKK